MQRKSFFMKYIKLAILASVMLFASCKKEDASRPAAVHCYECDFGSINEGQTGYKDVGCMPSGQWDATQFYDNTGNIRLDKAAHCRIKQ